MYGFYATAHDSNPGILDYTLLARNGPNATDESFELFKPFYNGRLMLTLRQETINDALGMFTRYCATGMSAEPIAALPYIFVRFQVPMAGYSSAPSGGPTFEWAIQFLTPVSGKFVNPPFVHPQLGESASGFCSLNSLNWGIPLRYKLCSMPRR